MLEIEQKFQLTDGSGSSLASKLEELGAIGQPSVNQSDTYYNHPSRDFGETDEALRVRTVGDQSFVTYKGPKQGSLAKTRYELELPLADQTAEGWHTILIKLGFIEVATVFKKRTPFQLTHANRPFEIVLDEVEGLGCYAEVETVVASKEEQELAEQAVVNLAAKLGLIISERRCYLEMQLGG